MGKFIKCQKGHFYDSDKFRKCPYCNSINKKDKNLKVQGMISDDLDDMVTVAQSSFAGSARKIRRPNVTGEIIMPKADIFDKEEEKEKQLAQILKSRQAAEDEPDDQKTVSLFSMKNGISPVVGWLVCVDGEEKGRDFRLIRGFNRVGRDRNMDVCIRSDPAITRDTHCSIAYDDKGNRSFIVPGNGTLTYLGKNMVQKPTLLQDGDEIEIGKTRFVFVSFCKGDRVWEKE